MNYEYLFAQYIQDSVYVQSEFRYYNVHVPVNYNGFSNLPLVLGFHGGGNQGWGNLDYYSEFKNKSDSAGFLLIFPEGKNIPVAFFMDGMQAPVVIQTAPIILMILDL